VIARSAAAPTPPPPVPHGSRATAMWAHDSVKPEPGASATAPFIGKLSAAPDEPAFAGRVRIDPGAESSFETGRVVLEDDDVVLPARRGSRAGMIVLIVALIAMGAAAAVVYMFVIRKEPVATAPRDAAVVAAVPDAAGATGSADAAAVVAEPVASPLEAPRAELRADVEARLRTAAQALDGKPDAPSQALRAHLIAQLAQDLIDRASVTADKAAADGLRKDAKQLVLDAATAAQRALKAAGDDAGANLAMAEVLRLQGKPAKDSQRYLDAAKAKNDKDWARDLALADALALQRDGKLDDARAAFAAIDQGDGKLETSGDVRARLHQALVLAAQSKAADAKPLVDAVLAAQPEHAAVRALAQKLETQVATGDAMPPEEDKPAAAPAPKEPAPPKEAPAPREAPSAPASGGSYDALLASANKIADTNCARAMELYQRALDAKPNGVEALTGMGYCYIDAKQFSSAHSKFRTALMVSPKYEPALRGIAEGYLQQGLKDRAIEAYRAYLEVYPNNEAAKKQLDRLGGSAAPAPAPPPAPSADPPRASDGQPQKPRAKDDAPSPGPTTSPDGQ
ncbi:MAG TPA: tetratricopeptide repeat protein, partial [Kofleriaceae bacterium]|nr:tetratricopeptide repeat protein [Kofleriaceae bacterium]